MATTRKEAAMPTVSVVIPVYNRMGLTRQCLDKLFSIGSTVCDFEVIVVDDGSRDSTQRLLASYGDRLRVVSHASNKAFATSCNDGAAIACGEYLLFLNNDTIPLQGWLDALVRHARAHPRAGVVASKLLYPNGTIQHAGMAVCQDRHPRLIYVGFPADHPAVNKPRRMQLVSGACNLIPRAIFAQMGGFDAAYINGYEDVDLCMRFGEFGYEIHYCPQSVLFHMESVSENRFKFEQHSALLFRQRWGDRVHPDDLHYYIEDGLIHVDYYANHINFNVSPLLGVIQPEDNFAEVNRVLELRAQQVYSLIRENVILRATGN
jgi:GT2 family glycosyltransferase